MQTNLKNIGIYFKKIEGKEIGKIPFGF